MSLCTEYTDNMYPMLFLETDPSVRKSLKTFEIIFIPLPPVESICVSNSAFCSSGNWMGKRGEKEKNGFLKMLRLQGDGKPQQYLLCFETCN